MSPGPFYRRVYALPVPLLCIRIWLEGGSKDGRKANNTTEDTESGEGRISRFHCGVRTIYTVEVHDGVQWLLMRWTALMENEQARTSSCETQMDVPN